MTLVLLTAAKITVTTLVNSATARFFNTAAMFVYVYNLTEMRLVVTLSGRLKNRKF